MSALLKVFALFFLLFSLTSVAKAQNENNQPPKEKISNDRFSSLPVNTTISRSQGPKQATSNTKLTNKKSLVKSNVNNAETQPLLTPQGEGYWQDETNNKTIPPPPAPQARTYSEVYASIGETGRLKLTSDVIAIKPEVKAPPTKLDPEITTGNKELDDIIQQAGRKYKVDPRLILEVMRQESGFRTQAISYKGAQGLMQLIPATAARFGVYRTYDPRENVEGGTRYLRFLLDLFKGNVELALAGYNAGENAVIRNNFQIPRYRETRDYVRSILARYRNKQHKIVVEEVPPPVLKPTTIAVFEAENGRLILSNNY